MTWITLGMMLLGAFIGYGLALVVEGIFLRIMPTLLVFGGMAWAYYVVTSAQVFPDWMMQDSLKQLSATWYGSLLLGGLGSLSLALAGTPVTATLSVRGELKENVERLETTNRELRAEIAALRSRLDSVEKHGKPSL